MLTERLEEIVDECSARLEDALETIDWMVEAIADSPYEEKTEMIDKLEKEAKSVKQILNLFEELKR